MAGLTARCARGLISILCAAAIRLGVKLAPRLSEIPARGEIAMDDVLMLAERGNCMSLCEIGDCSKRAFPTSKGEGQLVSIRQTAWVQPFAYGQGKLFCRLLADMLNRGREANARPTCGGEQRITDCVGIDAFHTQLEHKENDSARAFAFGGGDGPVSGAMLLWVNLFVQVYEALAEKLGQGTMWVPGEQGHNVAAVSLLPLFAC